MRNTKFHGIVAFGRSHQAAANSYRLLAMGKGATVLASESGSIALVTSETTDVFNPMTGDMDLVSKPELMQKMEFSSVSSELDLSRLQHFVCTSGCGTHIVADSKELMNYCPCCTSSLSGEDEPEDEEVPEEDDSEEAEGDDEGEEDFDLSDATSGDDEDFDLTALSEDEGEDSDDEDSDDEDSDDEDSEEEEPVVADSEEEPVVAVAASLELAMDVFRKQKNSDGVSLSGDSAVEYVVCSNSDCGAHIVHDIGVSVSNCPSCFSATEEPEEGDDAEIEITDETGGEDDAETEEADAPEADDSADESEEEEPEDDGDVAESESGDCEESESDDDESDDTEEEDDSDGNDLSLTDDEGNVDMEDGDVTEDIPAEASADDLDVSFSSSVAGQPMWTAYYKGAPIATACEADAGKNKDIFNAATFGHVVVASAKAGIRSALLELGFKPIKYKVSVSRQVNQMIEARIAEREQALAAERDALKVNLMKALSTAAVGINRGFFAGLKNPIKDSLWNSLSAIGIQNPEVVIDRAFAAQADAYHEVLFTKALELEAQPALVQESMSAAVLATGYQSASSGSTLEDRIEGLGTSVSGAKSVAQVSVSTDKVVSESSDDFNQISKRAVSSLGRPQRRF